MNRREFLETAGALSVARAPEVTQHAKAETAPASEWRTFRVTTQIDILQPNGATRVWVPLALNQNTPFQKTVSNRFHCDGGRARIAGNSSGCDLLIAEFPADVKPSLIILSEVKTRDWALNLANDQRRRISNASQRFDTYLKPTKLVPTDGIVRMRAQEITKGAASDVDKARAIYNWIVEKTYRNPKTRGCGIGDIRFMLESGDLGGKCPT